MTYEEIKNLNNHSLFCVGNFTYMFNQFVFTTYEDKKFIVGCKAYKLQVCDEIVDARRYEFEPKLGYKNSMLLMHELKNAELVPEIMEVIT